MKYYELEFSSGTADSIVGSKKELIAQLQLLIDEISDLPDDEQSELEKDINLADMSSDDNYIVATVRTA